VVLMPTGGKPVDEHWRKGLIARHRSIYRGGSLSEGAVVSDEHRRWVIPPRTGTFRDIDLEYLDPNDPDERRILIEAEHPEYADALEADDEVLVDGQPMNPSLHVSMHEIVTNQIWDLDPPETWATAQRLTDLGYDRHEVIHMLGGAVTTQLWRACMSRSRSTWPGSWRTWMRFRTRGSNSGRRRSPEAYAPAVTVDRGQPVRMRFDVDDEDEFFATSKELVAQFEARLTERGQSLDLASDADLMLNWKWGYADGDLAWWRTGHLDELLLEWYPRKVSAPPDLVDITLPSVAAFLGFLHEEGLLSSASDPIEVLQRHLGGMG
jgi:hypothetical protein